MLLLLILWISFRQYEGGNIVPVLHKFKSNITSKVGDSVKLECPISVRTDNAVGFYISWTVNGIDENMLSVDSRYQFKESNKILEVSNLRSDDAGIYVCKGVTGYGVKEAIFNIVIKDEKFCRIPTNSTPRTRFKPCFLNFLMQYEVSYQKIIRDIGSSVEFDCSAAGSPPPKYLWTKGKSSADWIENITGIRQPILRINKVKLEYSGYYTCRVSNSVGEISYTYTLIVREKHSKIPRINNNLGNITANIGAQAMLVGSITCNCKPVLQWLKKTNNLTMTNKNVPLPNARESEKDEFYVILDPENVDYPIEIMEKNNDVLVSVLKFRSVLPSDAGKYILFATNGNYGMSYGIAYLDIRDQHSVKTNHSRLVLYIAIPILILILCFGVIFYCWSRRHSIQRLECPKRLCVGSSSVSSSTNMQCLRSHYPGSTTTASATTGKCSNDSSIFSKQRSLPIKEHPCHLPGNNIPLLPHSNCNRTFSSSNENTINQDASLQSNDLSHRFSPQFSPNKDTNPYTKVPNLPPEFPHSTSRVSNSSQPNTQSGSSNCSGNTNRSNSYHSQPNMNVFNGTHNYLINNQMPPYNIDNGGNNQITLSDHCYTQHSEEPPKPVPNMYFTQDYFPLQNTSNSPNSYLFS